MACASTTQLLHSEVDNQAGWCDLEGVRENSKGVLKRYTARSFSNDAFRAARLVCAHPRGLAHCAWSQ